MTRNLVGLSIIVSEIYVIIPFNPFGGGYTKSAPNEKGVVERALDADAGEGADGGVAGDCLPHGCFTVLQVCSTSSLIRLTHGFQGI